MAPAKKTVVVTGFGPFSSFEVNPSWVAVKELKTMGLENYKLEIKQIPVTYGAIDKDIPLLYKKYKPVLMVHVGVSGGAQSIKLEQQAYNTGYYMKDNKGKRPKSNCCKSDGPSFLKSTIDMQKIGNSGKLKESHVNVVVSQDPGRFCCGYIYYTSLFIKHNHAAFVHVPPLNRPLDRKALANGLKAIILAMLDYISDAEES